MRNITQGQGTGLITWNGHGKGIVSHIPIMLILETFFSETNKHRTMKLYIATFPLSMHKLCFFVNIGETLVPFMEINTLINVKKIDS